MKQSYSSKIWKILICPLCGEPLSDQVDSGAICSSCEQIYTYSESGSLDLRLSKAKTYPINFRLGSHLPADGVTNFAYLPENPSPEVDFSGVSVPYHLYHELITYFPKAKGENSLMLDLGCGGTIHREVCEHAGFEYIGLDYDAPKAPFLGDAHSLPFQDDSFEFILSIAVLEHLRYPFVAMQEASRVLLPGGKFIGTVAFLEPFHLDSYYHHSHLGTLNSLQSAGFKVTHIAPHRNWSVLNAQASMSLFQRLPRRLANAVVTPVQILSNLWWRARQTKNRGRDIHFTERSRNTSGAFTFIAYKM
jgi:SAM-dependent methyltransferase